MNAWRGLRRLSCVLLAGGPALLFAQVPAGPQFQVNTYTTGMQYYGRAGVDSSGAFVVVWTSQPTLPGDSNVWQQRYDPAGSPSGSELRVNAYTTGAQGDPHIAMLDAGGRYVVVWAGRIQDGDGLGVFGRRFDPAGAPLGAEFLVNTYTTGHQDDPDVAAAGAGGFVVTWSGDGPDGEGVFARRFDAAGQPLGPGFRVSTVITAHAEAAAVAADAAGNFVVVWDQSLPGISNTDVYARCFDAAGLPRGAELRVNTHTTSTQLDAVVAAGAAGDFTIAWTGGYQDGDGEGIYAQRFGADGQPRGAEFRVNTVTTDTQRKPWIAADAAGNFVVAWQSLDQGNYSVLAQRFDTAGQRRGAEFRPGTAAVRDERTAAVGLTPFGHFVVAWTEYLGEGSYTGVFARRFGGLVPAALGIDGAAAPVWEPGESVDVRPTWRNLSGPPQTFGAVLSALTGPPGATYGVIDGSGGYGTVANGASAACTDCYRVMVSDPATRPATHWDATAQEAITPDAQGQVKRWALHIGRSFTDVPASNPFYRFAETLLHRGITGGCGAGTYCPDNATTRDQMSVFVLVAREGPGYLPPACTTAVFNDVPASNPFCRFIEELSRRGVVSGCGGGNYCPGNPVTREQMAVFVLRTLDPALNPPNCVAGAEQFADVPASSGFCKWIEELARRQVVTGCGGGNYCPGSPVTREQMGVFLSATFGLTLYGV